jgi:hypothetical protein
MKRQVILFLTAIVIISGCKTFKATAPSASYTPFVLKPQLSSISVPLEIPVQKLENTVNTYLTGTLYEDTNLEDDDMVMKVSKSSNIKLDVVGEDFKYAVPLKIWLKMGFKVEQFGLKVSNYQETNCALTVRLKSKIKIGPDWSISTVTTLEGYDWVTKPSIDLGLFDVPLTYVADKIIESQKAKLTNLLDQQTSKYMQVKQYIEPAWTKMQDPISLSTDPESYLTIQTTEIQMTPLMGRAGLIQSSVGIKAFLHYHLGAKPPVNYSPLPSLKFTNNETGSFSFSLVTDIDYAFAEQLSKKYFEGQVYEFNNGKKKIKVEEVTLYGNQSKLVIGMKLSGSLNGTVYVTSLPYYDSADKSIKVKELEFDLDTKNKLVKSANWLAHGIFLKKMQENLIFSIKDNLLDAEKMVQENITNKKINDYITIDGRLTRLSPENIFLTEQGISAVVTAKGLLNVELDIK